MVALRKLLSLAVVVWMLAACIPLSALAAETDELALIRVSNGNSEKIYQVVSRDSELYFPAEAYGEMTKYVFTASENYGYQLGAKTIIVDPKSGDMNITAQNYTENIGKGISIDGVDYLPASKLLPWMNVSCSVDDGVLTVVPDAVSIWEVLSDFDYSSYLFNVYDVYGESASSAVGLGSMIVFDTIINFRWDRLVPVGEEGSLYDYECYVSALSELGMIDCLDAADSHVSGASELISFEKALDIGEEGSAEDLEGALGAEGLDAATIQEITKVGDLWNTLKDCADVPGLTTDYVNVFAALKTYGLVLATDNDYREYLTWLSERGTGNSLFDYALVEARAVLDEDRGVAYTLASEFCKGLLSALPEEIFEVAAAGASDEAVKEAFAECSNATDFMGSLKTYTAISKVIYGSLFEDAVAGYEGMAKAGVLESIQNYCWDLAGSLRCEELTEETLMHIRQSYLTSLQASKQLFQAQQDTMNFGILADMGLLENGNGLLDSQIQLIDGKTRQLVVTSDAALNDSTEGKEEYADRLGDMFSDVTCFPATEPVVVDLSWTGTYADGELMWLCPYISGAYDDGAVLHLYADQAILQMPEGESASFDLDEPICYGDALIAQVQRDASRPGNVLVYLYRYDGVFNFEVGDYGYADHIADSYIQDSGVAAVVETPNRDDSVTYDLESGLYRSYTGAWFWAPFSLDHGELAEYDESLVLAESQGGVEASVEGKLADGEYPVSFDGESLLASNGNLYLTLSYYEHRYHDTQDILSLQPGDTVNYQGEEVLVEDVETYSWEIDGKTMYMVMANRGMGWKSDAADPGRMMEISPDSEDPICIEVGSTTLKISERACLYDESRNSMPQWDAEEVPYDSLLQHFAEYYSDPYAGGNPVTTTITVKDGEIVSIYHKWHP